MASTTMGTLKNKALNTVAAPIRAGVSAGNTGLDLIKTLSHVAKDFGEIVADTVDQIREVLKKGRAEGERYHKLWKAPASIPVSLGVAIEGAARSVLQPIGNALSHSKYNLGGFFSNIGSSIKSLWYPKPISEFSYEKVEYKPTKKNGRLRDWFKKR